MDMKWEYAELWVEERFDVFMKQPQESTLQHLNAMGLKGWEMTGIVVHPTTVRLATIGGPNVQILLKRQMQSDAATLDTIGQ